MPSRTLFLLPVILIATALGASAEATIAERVVGSWTIDAVTWAKAKAAAGDDAEAHAGIDAMAKDMANYRYAFADDGTFTSTYRSNDYSGTWTVTEPDEEGRFDLVMTVPHPKDPERTRTVSKTVYFDGDHLVWPRRDVPLYMFVSPIEADD